jgi:hypothetical protein
MAEYTPEELSERYADGLAVRRFWEPHLQEIGEHLIPRKATISTRRTPGIKAHKERFSSAPMHYHEVLAANLQGTLTSRSFRWFDLRIANDEELDRNHNVRTWLQDSSIRMWKALNQSNFHNQAHEFYMDLTGFGTANIICDARAGRRPWNGLQFMTTPIESYVFEEDEWGRGNAIFFLHRWSARQARAKFKTATFSSAIQKALEKDPGKVFEFLRCIVPRFQNDPSKRDNLNMPWADYWLEINGKAFLEEGGLHEFNSMPTRWSRNSGERYGRGPGSTALADIKVLNKATEFDLSSWAKTLDPPWFALDDGVIGKVDFRPGKGTIVRDRDALWFYESKARADISQIKFSELRESIQKTFFADQLELPQSDRMTAEEIRTRVEMMQRVLGPTLGRLETEYLNPLIDRVFNIMVRAGAFKEPPGELVEAFGDATDIEIKYSGPLARAERLAEVFAIQRVYDSLAQPAQVDPTVYDIINHDKAARIIAENQDIPEEIIRNDLDVQKIRKGRAEQQQQQQQMQAGLVNAQIAETQASAQQKLRVQ